MGMEEGATYPVGSRSARDTVGAPPAREVMSVRDLALRFHHNRPEDPDVGSEGSESVSLVDVFERAHRRIGRGLAVPPQASSQHLAPTMDGHDAEDAYDAEVATFSGHLAAVEAVVHPVARRHLPGGRAAVTAQRRRARRLERTMRLIEGRFYGDTHAVDMDLEGLQSELKQQAKVYARSELDLARRLDATLTSPQRSDLVERVAAAVKKAPTRPHPYTPHPRLLAGPILRACSAWDRALDVMDNRTAPGRAARRRPAALSLWGQYVLGTPTFEEEQQDTTPAVPADAPRPTGPRTR
jgi:hypothetical protein